MRPNIHPEYRSFIYDTNANAYFVIGSTLQSSQTKEYEGKVYPYVTLDISSASHPFYTGVYNDKPVTKAVWQVSINALHVSNAKLEFYCKNHNPLHIQLLSVLYFKHSKIAHRKRWDILYLQSPSTLLQLGLFYNFSSTQGIGSGTAPNLMF